VSTSLKTPLKIAGASLRAGALAGLQRRWPSGHGAQWVARETPFGLFTYSTYTEQSYDAIWDKYSYIDPSTWWFKQDFGKTNCSSADPQRLDVVPHAQQIWLQQVHSAPSWY